MTLHTFCQSGFKACSSEKWARLMNNLIYRFTIIKQCVHENDCKHLLSVE